MSRQLALASSAWLAAFAFVAMAFPMAATAAQPTITSFSPTSAYQGEYGQPITITGTNFNCASTVSLGGRNASFKVKSSTVIVAYVPSSATSNPLSVTTPTGTAYGPVPFYVNPIPRPVISSFSPTFAYTGESGKSITITGNYFKGITTTKAYSGVTSVKFGNLSASFTVMSATTIKAIVPDNAVSYGISVTSAGGIGYSMDAFEIRAIPAPTITTFTPASVYVGETGKSVTINGTNFLGIGAASKKVTGVTAVSVGGKPTTFRLVGATQLIAAVPAGATTNLLSVTTSGGTCYSAEHFTINPIPRPTIVSLDPAWAYTGQTCSVTIKGTNFNGIGTNNNRITGTTAVSVGSIDAGYSVLDNETIVMSVPANAVSGAVAVTTAGGTCYGKDPFYIKPIPAPVVSSFLPASGRVGTTVTITGQYFCGDGTLSGLITPPTVTIGNVPATVVTVSSTTITAVVGALATNGGISVTTNGGTGYSNDYFTVVVPKAPTITYIDKMGGQVGEWVRITGKNFDVAPAIAYFHGVQCAEGWVESATSIYVRIPVGATTGKITVVTPGGTAASACDFMIGHAPVITGFNANHGVAGDTINIEGDNFTGATSVTFKGIEAFFSVTNDDLISATVPSGDVAGVISVTTPYGYAVSTNTFNSAKVPTIIDFDAWSGVPGDWVTITGTNFDVARAVYFNGTAVVTLNYIDPTRIDVMVPAGATTGPISVDWYDGSGYSVVDSYYDFEIIPAPTITDFTNLSYGVGKNGHDGDIIGITGKDFTDTTTVWFGPMQSVSVVVWSSTYMTATVPTDAVGGTQCIYAVSEGGTGSMAGFNVYEMPTITDCPNDATIGVPITVRGTHFVGATAVTFGTMVQNVFTVVDDNTITVAPPVGAPKGVLYVTNPAGTARTLGEVTIH